MLRRIFIFLLLASVTFGDIMTTHQKPTVDDTLDLGSFSIWWRNLYAHDVYFDTITLTVTAGGGFVLLETGDVLLLETGDKLVLEGTVAAGNVLFLSATDTVIHEANYNYDTATNILSVEGLTVPDSAVIGSDSAVFQPNADLTTFFQILDAAGAVVANVDTTNSQLFLGATTRDGGSGPLYIRNDTGNAVVDFDRSGTRYGIVGVDATPEMNLIGINIPVNLSVDGGTTSNLAIDASGVTTIGDGGVTNYTEINATGDVSTFNGHEHRFYDTGSSNYVGFEAPALTANQIWVLPAVDGSADDIIKTDGSGNLDFVTPTVDMPLSFTLYDAEPARASETHWNGGLLLLTAGTIASPTSTQLGPTTPADDISVSKGIGKIVVVVVAGSDVAGTITVTGEKIDRDTGASTPAHTNTITVDAVTTDGSSTDSNGNRVHSFTGAYITDDWFTGTVVLSTTTLNLTCFVLHVSFEQFNDMPGITVNTLDANIFTTNVNAEFDAYLYDLHKEAGNKCDIENHASLHVGADGETAIANKYWRLRRGSIAQALDGTTDGVWIDAHYSNSPSYVEDVTIKLWATCQKSVDLN